MRTKDMIAELLSEVIANSGQIHMENRKSKSGMNDFQIISSLVEMAQKTG